MLFEDDQVEQLYPLALARPVFELVCGREGLRRRLQRWFPSATWGVKIRPWLSDVYQEEHPSARVNTLTSGTAELTLLINGRWLPERRLTPADVDAGKVGVVDEQIAWIAVDSDELNLLGDLNFYRKPEQRPRLRLARHLARMCWAFVIVLRAPLVEFETAGYYNLPDLLLVAGPPLLGLAMIVHFQRRYGTLKAQS